MDVSHVTMYNPAIGPAKVVIHGGMGTGKTTTACYFPRPLIMGAENGLPRDLGFEVPIVRPTRWLDWFDMIASLTHDRHDYDTAVIDTADWLEPQAHRFVCDRDSERETEMNPKKRKLESIEDYGYGKGFLVVEEEFLKLLHALDVMQYKRGLHVVILMHSIVRTVKNPMGPDYDRWEPKCHARVTAKITEWAENVLFLYHRSLAGKLDEDIERHKSNPERAKVKGILGTSQRIVGAAHCAMYDAKNRVRMPHESELGDPNDLVATLLGEALGKDVQSLAARVTRPNAARSAPTPEPAPSLPHPMNERARDAEPPRNADYQSQPSRADQRELSKWGRDERTMAMDRGDIAGAVDAPPHLRVVPPVPAHHPDRVEDEARRRDEAIAKASGRSDTPHPNAPPQSVDKAKTESRTWTEPAKTPAPEPEPRRAAPRDAKPDPRQGALIERVHHATVNAERVLGAEFRKQVEYLVTEARGNLDAIEVICNLVDAVMRGESLGPKYRGDMQLWITKSQGDLERLRAIIKRINKDTEANANQPAAQ